MKITLDKNITIGDAAQAKRIVEDFTTGDNNESLNKDDMQRAGEFYIDGFRTKMCDLTAKVSYNSRCDGCFLQGEEDRLSTRYPLDIWVEMFVRGSETCAEVGFYLTDYWQLTGDNSEEIRKRAYINAFKRVE